MRSPELRLRRENAAKYHPRSGAAPSRATPQSFRIAASVVTRRIEGISVMRLKRLLASGVAVAVLSCAAGSAQAALMVATFRGVITQSVSDMTFGSANLVGMTYTATYTFDPSLGATSIYNPCCSGYFDYIRAGYDAASPILSALIEINGRQDFQDYKNDATTYGNTERVSSPGAPFGSLYMSAVGGQYVPSPVGGTAYDYHSATATFTSPTLIPFDMTQAWSPQASGAYGTASFLRQVQNAGRGYDQAYDIRATITSVRVFDAAVVPEPATWALLILGFGAAGTALRRRRAEAVA